MYQVEFVPCSSYQASELDNAVARLLGKYDFSGKKVLIKPNWLSYRRPEDLSSVHPQLLIAVTEYIHRHQASYIAIRESPGTQNIHDLVRQMRLEEQLSPYHAEISPFQHFNIVPGTPESKFRRLELAVDYQDFDLMLNLAKVKTHMMMTTTLAVKNLFGLVNSSERLAWHLNIGKNYDDFADMLLDIYLAVRPAINLIDGVQCMEGNGPAHGTPKAGNFLAVCNDALALDAALCKEVLQLQGNACPILKRAAERHLIPAYVCGENMPAPIQLELPPLGGIQTLLNSAVPRKIQQFLQQSMVNYPAVDASRCRHCGLCVKVCPPHSLEMKKQLPKFHLSSCIRCYCCQEHCPVGAITVKTPRLRRFAPFIIQVVAKITYLVRLFKRNPR